MEGKIRKQSMIECNSDKERFAFELGAKFVIDKLKEICSEEEVLNQIYKVRDLNAYESRGFKSAIDYVKKKMSC